MKSALPVHVCWTRRARFAQEELTFTERKPPKNPKTKNPGTSFQRKGEFQKNTVFVHCNRQLTCQSQMFWAGLDYLSPANSAGLFSTNQILFGKFKCLTMLAPEVFRSRPGGCMKMNRFWDFGWLHLSGGIFALPLYLSDAVGPECGFRAQRCLTSVTFLRIIILSALWLVLLSK